MPDKEGPAGRVSRTPAGPTTQTKGPARGLVGPFCTNFPAGDPAGGPVLAHGMPVAGRTARTRGALPWSGPFVFQVAGFYPNSSRQVIGPISPSTTTAAFLERSTLWKARTSRSVSSPKIPSNPYRVVG